MDNLREKIIERGRKPIDDKIFHNDIKFLQKFHNNFSENFEKWNELMDNILNLVIELDKKCLSENYYGFKEALISEIINISMSYIIIGRETISGVGIDNLRNHTMKYGDENKLTIEQKINIFLKNLPDTMDKNSIVNQEILKLDRNHSQILQEESKTDYLIKTLRANIKLQEKNMKIKSKADEKKLIKENMEENKQSLEDALYKLSILKKDIENIIAKKKVQQDIINANFHRLFNYLEFDYFMHDDWSPILDSGLFPK